MIIVCRTIDTGSNPVPVLPVAYEVERTFDKRKKMVQVHPGLKHKWQNGECGGFENRFLMDCGFKSHLVRAFFGVLSLGAEYHTFTVETRVRFP